MNPQEIQTLIDKWQRQIVILEKMQRHARTRDLILSRQSKYTDPNEPLFYGNIRWRLEDEGAIAQQNRMIELLKSELFTGYRNAIPHELAQIDHLMIHLSPEFDENDLPR